MSTPGWQPDPTGRHEYRYWDGTRWTDDVANGGTPAVDPQPTAVQPASSSDLPGYPPGFNPGTVEEPDLHYADDDGGRRGGGGGGLSTGLLVAMGLLVLCLAGGIVFVLLNQDDDNGDSADQPAVTTTASTTTTTAPTTTTTGSVESGQLVEEFAEAIAAGSEGRFSAEEARCMASGILDAVGLQRLAEVRIQAQQDATTNPVDLLTDDEQEKAFAAMQACVPAGELNQAPTSG